ncbi:MAG: PDZ domain-containing protein [Candidatus Solibacter sp.]
MGLPHFRLRHHRMDPHDPTAPLDVTVLRGSQTLQFQVPAVTTDDRVNREISIDPHESLIAESNVFGKTVTPAVAVRSGRRSSSGVYVIARTASNEDSGTELAPGDVIAALNGTPILDREDLRNALRELKGGKTAVLQIERRGQFVYVERDL